MRKASRATAIGRLSSPLIGDLDEELRKRLEDGAFRWPNIQDGIMRLSAAQFSALLEGLDWRRVYTIETTTPVQAS